MNRKQNFQSIAWFNDLHTRKLIDLDPPYQRRSVWNQEFRDYFIDTLLLNYPAPAIFLYEEISPDGALRYAVVDGKQRLTAIFDFVGNLFPVGPKANRTELQGMYFKDLSDDLKRMLWAYQFSVEYLPVVDETVISNIFDRINRNTKRLSAQELRHAKFGGEFITEAERLADSMKPAFDQSFPNIARSSRSQMKDVEFVAELLLLLESGPRGYSTETLDSAFSERDSNWEQGALVVEQFEATARFVLGLLTIEGTQNLRATRLKNQADFYSLFGASAELLRESPGMQPGSDLHSRLYDFATKVDDAESRQTSQSASMYYEAARSASNDTAQRKARIEVLKQVMRSQSGE